jgi:hypothetical protein
VSWSVKGTKSVIDYVLDNQKTGTLIKDVQMIGGYDTLLLI